MKRFRTGSDGDYWRVEPQDYETRRLEVGTPCACCGTIHATTMHRFKVTNELLCTPCMVRQNSLYVPHGTELELKVREFHVVRKLPSMRKPQKVEVMMQEIQEKTKGGEILSMQEIETIAGSHGLTMKDFMRYRSKPRMPQAPMGTVRLDKPPTPKSEEEFILDVAVSQVKDEGREVDEVAEEFGLTLEQLELRLKEEGQ